MAEPGGLMMSLTEAATVIPQGSILEAVPISPGHMLGSPTPTAQSQGADLPNEEQIYKYTKIMVTACLH